MYTMNISVISLCCSVFFLILLDVNVVQCSECFSSLYKALGLININTNKNKRNLLQFCHLGKLGYSVHDRINLFLLK